MKRLIPNSKIEAYIGQRGEFPPVGCVKLRDWGQEVIFVRPGMSIEEKAEVARFVNKTCGLDDHAKNAALKGYLVQAFKATFGDDPRAMRIVEVGCGERTILEHVGKSDCKLAERTSYVGIDIDSTVFTKAKINLRETLRGCAFPNHAFGTWESVNLTSALDTKQVGVGVYSIHHMLTDAAEIADAATKISEIIGASGMFVANAYGPNFVALEKALNQKGFNVRYVPSDIGQIAVMFPKINHKADAETRAAQTAANRDAVSFIVDLGKAVKSGGQASAPVRKVA